MKTKTIETETQRILDNNLTFVVSTIDNITETALNNLKTATESFNGLLDLFENAHNNVYKINEQTYKDFKETVSNWWE